MKIESIICISESKSGKVWMQKQGRKKQFSFAFLNPPKRLKGASKLEFYLFAISEARKLKLENVLVIDDSYRFIRNPRTLPELPDDYELLCLSGVPENVRELFNENFRKFFTEAEVSDCRAFLVNSKAYDKILEMGKEKKARGNGESGTNGKNRENEVSWNEFWVSVQKSLAASYFLKTNISAVVPREDYIGESKTLFKGFDSVPITTELKEVPEDLLPHVTLVTVTSTSSIPSEVIFFFTILNFYKLNYPKDKLEWIIVDDTGETKVTSYLDEETKEMKTRNQRTSKIQDLIPREESRIKYLDAQSEGKLTLGKKLNAAISYANQESAFVLHFFEGNWYLPDSVMQRVLILLQESPAKECTGVTKFGVYNLLSDVSFEKIENDKSGYPTILYEPSMAYTLNFWKTSSFPESIRNDNTQNVVSIPFLMNRKHRVITLPYQHICVSVDFKKLREKIKVANTNFTHSWDLSLRQALSMIKEEMNSEAR